MSAYLELITTVVMFSLSRTLAFFNQQGLRDAHPMVTRAFSACPSLPPASFLNMGYKALYSLRPPIRVPQGAPWELARNCRDKGVLRQP